MARRRLAPKLGTVLGIIVFCVILAAVYQLRSSNTTPSAVSGNAGAPAPISSLPIQVLTPTSGQPDDALPGSQPGGPTAPNPDGDPATSTTTPVTAPVDGANTVPDGWSVINVYLDGWSLASTPETIEVSNETYDTRGEARFLPLTPTQLRGALREHPDVIAAYLARMITSDPNVTCTADSCTADGAPLDLDQLAEPQQANGLGPMYASLDITTGVYLARIAVPSDTPDITLATSRGSVTIPGPGAGEAVPVAPETPPGTSAAPNPSSSPTREPHERDHTGYALAAGYGLLFPLAPGWADPRYEREWQWSNYPSTSEPDALLGTDIGPLLLAGPSSDRSSTLLSGAHPTLLTWLSSPTVGCGIAPLCSPKPVPHTVDSLTNTAGTACYREPSAIPAGRAVLLRQDLTVTVTPDRPIYLPGVGNGDGTTSRIDVTQITPTTEPVTFTQTGVYAIDDIGLVAYGAARNAPLVTTDIAAVFNGEFVSCTSAP